MKTGNWALAAALSLGLAQAGGGVRITSALNCPPIKTSGPAINCQWRTPSGTLVVEGNPRKSSIKLSATSRAGKSLWSEERVDFIQSVKVMDDVLLVQTSNNGIGAYITLHTALISSKLERPVWVWGMPIIARPTDHLALFTQEDVIRPEDSAGLAFQRVTLTPEIRVDPIHFDQPSRPSCGVAHGGWEAFGQPKFTQRYVYAVRQDSCGYFMTRFDWVTPQAKPLSYPIPAPH